MSSLRHGDSDCRANKRLQLPQPKYSRPCLGCQSPQSGMNLLRVDHSSPPGKDVHTHTLEWHAWANHGDEGREGLSLMGAQIDQGNTLGKRTDTEKNLKKHRVTSETWRGNTTVWERGSYVLRAKEKNKSNSYTQNGSVFSDLPRKSSLSARPLKRERRQPQAGISNESSQLKSKRNDKCCAAGSWGMVGPVQNVT